MTKKPLRVAMIGYGFMGRAHSNAYRKVNAFFPELEHEPVLQVACARKEEQARAFAAERGGIEWLVNNAGAAESAPVGRTDEDLAARIAPRPGTS